MIGIIAAFAPFASVLRIGPDPARTLVVGGDSTFGSIAEAMAVARSGDVIQLQPGSYMEQVVLRAGVELRASIAGKAILTAPEGNDRWVAITAGGHEGGRIYGLRVESSPAAPMTIGVEVASGEWWIEAMEFEGAMKTGIAVASDVDGGDSSRVVPRTRRSRDRAQGRPRGHDRQQRLYSRAGRQAPGGVDELRAAMLLSRPTCSPDTAEMPWQA